MNQNNVKDLARSVLVIAGYCLNNRKSLVLHLSGVIVCVQAIRHRSQLVTFGTNAITGTLELTRNTIGARLYSYILNKFSSKIGNDYRKVFKNCQLDMTVATTTNSHAKSATDRTKANTLCNMFVSLIGKTTYSISMSEGERRNLSGNRFFYTAKDLQSELVDKKKTKNHVIRMTDVDYYVDMNLLLDENDVLLYTFVPERVGGNADDATFSIDNNNQVNMVVNGGANYIHPLWNYDSDHFIIDHWWGSSLYLVEQRQVAPQRRVIYFNFIRKVYGPLAWILPGQRLKKRKFNIGGLNYMKVQTGTDKNTIAMHNFGKVSSFTSGNVSDSCLQTIMIRLAATKTPQISDIERILRAHQQEMPDFMASILFEMYMTNKELLRTITTTNNVVAQCVQEPDMYQTTYPLITEDAKPSCRRITAPILDEGVHPGKSFNNDNACINGRIKSVKNEVTKYPPFYYTCLSEFVNMLIPDEDVGTLVPYDYDDQFKRFTKPTQRSLVEAAKNYLNYDDIWTVKSFQKAETYGKITAPRNISTLPMHHNFRLGQYSYALSEHIFKTSHWYAFGLHPTEITKRVQTKVSKARFVVPTDISKCDGSTGYIHYCLTQAVVMRAFAPEYHNEVLALLKKEAYAKGVTSHGLVYEVDYNTLSGSSMTSWRNSVINAFLNYVAIRTNILDPKEAYEALGIYGGDDGITCDIDPSILERIVAKMGMLLKAEKLDIGSPIPFLGRLYIDPWTTNESIIDVCRQVKKFHLTSSPTIVPTNLVLYRKAEGYCITDKDTPIISDWCNWVKKNVPAPSDADLKRFQKYLDVDTTFWSKYDSPFPTITSHDLVRSIVCTNMSITPNQLDEFKIKLSNIHSFDLDSVKDFFTPVLKIEIEASYRGNLVNGNAPNHQTLVKNNANNNHDRNVALAIKLKEKYDKESTERPIKQFTEAPILNNRKQKLAYNNIKYCNNGTVTACRKIRPTCKFQHKQ
jgi:hypothetical protein